MKEEGLLFGPAGIPASCAERSTEAGIQRVHELGLGCMEVEFVQGVRMGAKSALAVAEAAKRTGVKLSAHGPYFINLNAVEPDKVEASRQRIIQTARVTSLFGGQSIVFHAAFYLNDPPADVYSRVKTILQKTLAELRAQNINVWVRPEVMGKPTQFGTLEEIISLSKDIPGVLPAVDFSHWHARNGKGNTYEEFTSALDLLESGLGRPALDNMLMHVSGIEYGAKGERKHLELRQSDFNYRDLMRALKDRKVRGSVVCESPNLEEDALLLQKTYMEL